MGGTWAAGMLREPRTLYRCFHERRMTKIRGPAVGACPGSTYEGVDAMGRGRQKAKQTKVARELKYFSPQTDYDALQREPASGGHDPYAGVEGPAATAHAEVERAFEVRARHRSEPRHHVEDRSGSPGAAIDDRVDADGQHPRQVGRQPATGDMGDRVEVGPEGAGEVEDVGGVDPGGLEQ